MSESTIAEARQESRMGEIQKLENYIEQDTAELADPTIPEEDKPKGIDLLKDRRDKLVLEAHDAQRKDYLTVAEGRSFAEGWHEAMENMDDGENESVSREIEASTSEVQGADEVLEAKRAKAAAFSAKYLDVLRAEATRLAKADGVDVDPQQ